MICRIESLGENEAKQDLEREIPNRYEDNDGNKPGQNKKDGVLEPLVERHRAPARALP
jgi:hypothetical protein